MDKMLISILAAASAALVACAETCTEGVDLWRAALKGDVPAEVTAKTPVLASAQRRAGLLRLVSSAAVEKTEGEGETDGTVTLADGTVARIKGAVRYVSGDSISGSIKVGKSRAGYECEGGLFAIRFDEKGQAVAMAGARLRGMDAPGLRIGRMWPGYDVAMVKTDGKWHGTVYMADPRAPLPPPLKAVTDNWTVRQVVKFAPGRGYREREAREIEDRVRLIAAPAPDELVVRATFCSCGWHWTCGEKVEGLAAEYRKAGDGAWRQGLPPEYFAETRSCRASITYLDEDTDYELRLVAGGRTLKEARFRTWASEVPVAKTVEIDPATFRPPYRITEKGTKDGWIRYVVKGGRLELREAAVAFQVEGAQYVLLDGMTVVSRAGAPYVVNLVNTKDVRVRNCDFSGWGRPGRPDYAGRALGKPVDDRGQVINCDGAVNITRGCENTVVERCWIHDAAVGSNSWRYSHPSGGQAVVVAHAGPGTVIRYNDFVGSDLHRWNDAVEGPGNFFEDGGLNRDADVYGNFMIFCADDNIELDGGQQNVRCFRNRFENALCGVSIQGCMVGPSYVFDNAFTGGSEEFSLGGAEIKTSGVNLYGCYTCAYLFGNDFWKHYTRVNTGDRLMRYVLRDNRSEGEPIFQGAEGNPLSVDENNTGNVAFRRDGAIAMPYRPVPFELDRGMIEGVRLMGATVEPASVQVTATVGGEGYERPFAVAQNADFEWFTVSPAKGVLRSGEKTVFTVTFNPARMHGRHEYRGAFLVRTSDGYSRPVSVYAEGAYANPFRPEKQWMFAKYLDWTGSGEYRFSVPKDGKYFILAYVRSTTGPISYEAALDGAPKAHARFSVRPYWTWQLMGINLYGDARCSVFDLKAGEHVLAIRDVEKRIGKDCELEALVVTDDPGPFEPR